MVTVTFQIKPYLAAYMYMRYKNHLDVPPDRSSSSLSAIHLLDTQPIYHFLHQLSIPHPPNASWHETGNITFTLPHPRNGKNPNVYNYIGHNSALIIEKAMEVEMRAELYEFLLENRYTNEILSSVLTLIRVGNKQSFELSIIVSLLIKYCAELSLVIILKDSISE